MASAKNLMLRQSRQASLQSNTGEDNYFGIAHITFTNPPKGDFKWLINSTDFDNANFSDPAVGEKGLVDSFLSDGDFYYTFDGDINKASTNKKQYFQFTGDDGTNFVETLAYGTKSGPNECKNGSRVWVDVDRLTTRTNRGSKLYSYDDDNEDTGEQFTFKCWPTEPNKWIDEDSLNKEGQFEIKNVTDISLCKGRNGNFEQYIVVLPGRAHDSECDFVVASTAANGSPYGAYCTDPLNKKGYPNNECNTKENCLVNHCDIWQFYDLTKSTCGRDRKNPTDTLNQQNTKVGCTNVTTEAQMSNGTWYLQIDKTYTTDNKFAQCPLDRSCDGTSLPSSCYGSGDGNNKLNPGTPGASCQPSGIGKEVNTTTNATIISCDEGYFAGAADPCGQSSVNHQPNAEKGGEVACETGYLAELGEVCTACTPGKIADTTVADGTCSDCPNGQYSGRAATVCVNCPPRHESTDGNSLIPCEKCDAGEVVDKVTKKCTAVGTGNWQMDNSDDIQPCGAGSQTEKDGIFTDLGKANGCETCQSLGKWDHDNDSETKCVDINAGEKRLNSTNTFVNCSAGTASAAGDNNCVFCTPGKSTDGITGAASCSECAMGKFADTDGLANCKVPDEGYYAYNSSMQKYCGDNKYATTSNRSACTVRKTTLNAMNEGSDTTWIRINYNLMSEHDEEAIVRCGTDFVARNIIAIEDNDGFTPGSTAEKVARQALNDKSKGSAGQCFCKRPFGQTDDTPTNGHYETDDTTGCANNLNQCLGRLTCLNSCNRMDRSDTTKLKCEVVYAKVAGFSGCVGYHGNIPTRWSETWEATDDDVTCSEAVVSTLPILK